ncbi:MAG: DUF4129 domain-containing protein [Theionarchaea archaeon]|nr:DUF4129 domain-containing protein [Theionarchaea archaeon]
MEIMRLWSVAAFAVMIIAVGHLIFLFGHTESTPTPAISSGGSRHVVLDSDYFPILCDILLIVIIIGGFKGSLRLRKNPQVPDEDHHWWVLMIARVSGLALMAALYVFLLRNPLKTREFLKIFRGFRDIQQAGEEASYIITGPTSFDQYLIILLSLVIVVIIAIIIVSMFQSPSREDIPVLIPLREFILKKREYTFNGPPRDIVIDTYGAALETLQKKGIHMPEYFTPWEVQRQVNSSHFTTLTRLFEKARYSIHPITQKDSEKALKMLEKFKNEELHIPERYLEEP